MDTKRQWDRIKEIAEHTSYGTLEVVLRNGVPVRVDIKKTIKLDSEEEYKESLKSISLG